MVTQRTARVAPIADDVPSRDANNRDLEAVFRIESPRLMRFFRRRIGQVDDAYDLLQEAFLRLARISSMTLVERPDAYLHRIAGNLLRDRAKAGRRSAYDLHIPSDDAMLESPALEPQLEARDMLNRVDAAMLQLKPRTREVFMACRVDGLSYAEIRERTGLSFKAIEKEMARALAHLHRTVGRE
jgi:RNA polymerase sigma-70 factor (ECF subfamily)